MYNKIIFVEIVSVVFLCALLENGIITTSDFILAITALILLWYTIETHLLRVQTGEQNKLISKQLEIMRDTFVLESQKLQSSLEPIFKYNGSLTGAKEIIHVVNKGAGIRDVRIFGDEHIATAQIDPSTFIGPGDEADITFSWLALPLEGKFDFTIEYKNFLGGKTSKTYSFNRNLTDISARLVERA